MTKIKLSIEAAEFVRGETAYLRQRNPSAAKNFGMIVRRAKETLSTFQAAGNSMHGLNVAGGLTLVVESYLFDYISDGDTVDILAIRHGRMLQSKPDLDDESDHEPEPEDPDTDNVPGF